MEDEYNIKNQKKDRNVTSNLIHHLIKYLLVSKGPQELIESILQNLQLSITYEAFYEHLENEGRKLKTYVTTKHIK